MMQDSYVSSTKTKLINVFNYFIASVFTQENVNGVPYFLSVEKSDGIAICIRVTPDADIINYII